MGWLDSITSWLRETFAALWADFVEYMDDRVLEMAEAVMDLFASIVEAIPVPAFLDGMSLGFFLAQLPPGTQWMMGQFKIPEGLALLAAGVVFRLLRKLLTLGQW